MHLYLHVPFCARRCSYCDFAIAVRAVTPEVEYVQAVLTEWRARRQHPTVRRDPDLTTVYFGGGDTLPARQRRDSGAPRRTRRRRTPRARCGDHA